MITRTAGPRIVAVDLARGVAIVAMIAYHVAWDLHAFGWSPLDPGQSPPWHWFGQLIASTFLFLSGLSLLLAHRRGVGPAQAFRRIAVIASAAAAVTLVTAVVSPGQTIIFGILHCIALGDLLALPLVLAPAWAALACAAISFAVPVIWPDVAGPNLWWLGLSRQIPDTLDVRPLLPWAGVIFLGVAIGQANLPLLRVQPTPGKLLNAIAATGRHTLLIYLAHQPLLFAAFQGAAYLAPKSQPSPLAMEGFADQCVNACVAKDTDPERCAAMCRCVQRMVARDPDGIMSKSGLAVYAMACRDGQRESR